MNAQHTPGPWHAEWMPGSSLFAIRHESGRIAYTTQMLSRASQARAGEFAANALLLAAAPELLEASDQLLAKITDELDLSKRSPDFVKAVKALRAAIAKARGQ